MPTERDDATPGEQLDYGSVERWAQSCLRVLIDELIVVDGLFGAASQQALKKFQRLAGLERSGSLGPATIEALARQLKVRAPGPGGAVAAQPDVAPEPEMIFGIDVSKHQGRVDFRALLEPPTRARPPFEFAIVKATEGGDHLDPKFKEHWAKLLELDPGAGGDGPTLIRGVYHFARPDNRKQLSGEDAGATEAKWLCKVLKEAGGYYEGCLPPFLDWEVYPGTGWRRSRAWIEGFSKVVFDELGRVPGIYTGPNVWKHTTNNWDEIRERFAIWQVKYQQDGWRRSVRFPRSSLNTNGEPWPWTLWQWSGGGKYNHYTARFGDVPGVKSGVADINRFDGTREELRTLARLGDGPFSFGDDEAPEFSPPAPAQDPQGGIFQVFDLSDYDPSRRFNIVAIVQGLMMAKGLGPEGLVDERGTPSGRADEATQDALRLFKQEHGLNADTSVDPTTWWLMLSP